MRKAIALISLIVAAFAVPASAADLPVIKVGHVGHDHQLALYVAADEGRALEKPYGVYLEMLKDMEVYVLYDGGRPVAQVQLILVGGGSKMPAALEQGHIEVGLGGLAPTVKFIDKGAAIKVLAPLNNGGDALIVGNHVKASSWGEFIKFINSSNHPVRVGYKDPLSVAYLIFSKALEAEGLHYGSETLGPDGKPVEVVMVNMNGLGNALPTLEAGIVDAVVVNEPMGSILVHKGVGKRAADLSTLPPRGKWESHPCCVVAARTEAIDFKRPIIKSLLKVIAAGADVMARDGAKALKAETRWTMTPAEVGRESIENVEYVTRPGRKWKEGVDTWAELMTGSGYFRKDLKDLSPAQVRERILNLDILNEALGEMKLQSVK